MSKFRTVKRDSNFRNNRLKGGKLQPLATVAILSGHCLSALWIKSDIKKGLRCITLLNGKLWSVALNWQPAATIRRSGQCVLQSICQERAQERLGKLCCLLALQWVTPSHFHFCPLFREEEGPQISTTHPVPRGNCNLDRGLSSVCSFLPSGSLTKCAVFSSRNACIWKVLCGGERFEQEKINQRLDLHAQCITCLVLGCELLRH